MLELLLEDFLEEIKGELFSYEEISEEKIFEWEEKMLDILNNNKSKTLKTKKIKIIIFLFYLKTNLKFFK